jgi:hypothetical protein
VTFLSPVEQAYLSGNREFTKPQQRYIRYRINKKLRLLDEELQVFAIQKSSSSNKSRDAAAAELPRLDYMVAQPGRVLRQLNEKERIMRRSLGGDLDPRPLPLGSRLFEPYLTKVTLYQAELPRQLNEQSNQ